MKEEERHVLQNNVVLWVTFPSHPTYWLVWCLYHHLVSFHKSREIRLMQRKNIRSWAKIERYISCFEDVWECVGKESSPCPSLGYFSWTTVIHTVSSHFSTFTILSSLVNNIFCHRRLSKGIVDPQAFLRAKALRGSMPLLHVGFGLDMMTPS